jgi:hypothetical protein
MRIILDVEDDVIRDIEIEEKATLEQLHDTISQSFGFLGSEMASFYHSGANWEQGEELPLIDMGIGDHPMNKTLLSEIFIEGTQHLIYVYDFLNLWTFFVELIENSEKEVNKDYPVLIFSHGEVPKTPPIKEFNSKEVLKDDFLAEGDLEDDLEDEIDPDSFY